MSMPNAIIILMKNKPTKKPNKQKDREQEIKDMFKEFHLDNEDMENLKRLQDLQMLDGVKEYY